MYCKKCGAWIPENAEICGSCGTSVRLMASPERSDGPPRKERTASKSANRKLLVGILAAVISILLVMVFVFVTYMRNQQDKRLAYYQEQLRMEQEQMQDQKAIQMTIPQQEPISDTEDTAEQPGYFYYGQTNTRNYEENTDASLYLWPTAEQVISRSDLEELDRDSVRAIVNEIYARHGYVFQKERWVTYFESRSWYAPDESCFDSAVAEARMNSIEKANLNTITAYEEAMGWK